MNEIFVIITVDSNAVQLLYLQKVLYKMWELYIYIYIYVHGFSDNLQIPF
jgi:hypothetical protein